MYVLTFLEQSSWAFSWVNIEVTTLLVSNAW